MGKTSLQADVCRWKQDLVQDVDLKWPRFRGIDSGYLFAMRDLLILVQSPILSDPNDALRRAMSRVDMRGGNIGIYLKNQRHCSISVKYKRPSKLGQSGAFFVFVVSTPCLPEMALTCFISPSLNESGRCQAPWTRKGGSFQRTSYDLELLNLERGLAKR